MGVYQLKQAKSYIKEHLAEDGQYELMLCREKPDLIKVQVRSQHVASKVYNLWIEYSNGLTPISGWYCQYPLAERSIWMSPSGTITVISGTSQALECQVKGGNPLVTLTWRCKGSEVVGVNLSKDSLSASRLIVPVDQTYNGKECVCTATNSTTTIGEKTVVFDVIYAPTYKLMMSPSGNKDIGAGDSVTLDCHVRGGNPIATLTWRCKGALRTGKNLTSTDTARSTLTVTVDKTYNGHICACIATQQTNPGREIGRKTVEFNVIYPPLATNIYLLPSGTETVTNGTTQRLECQLKGGNPLATLTWRCKESPRIGVNLTTSNLSASRLTFTVDETYHGQQCVCTATYSKTTIGTKTVVFNVLYAPVINLNTSKVILSEGESFNRTCSAHGNPSPNVSWVQDFTTLPSTGVLFFSRIEKGDAGIYVCLAENGITSQTRTKSFRIIVQYAPEVDLAFTNMTENTTNASLNCTARGVPSVYKFRWIHKIGSTVVRDLDDHVINSESVSTLTLPRVSYQDMGTYICEVENGIKGSNGQIVQTKQGIIFVEGSPRAINAQGRYLTEKNTSLDFNITYVSFPAPVNTSLIRYGSTLPVVTVSAATVTLPFYHKNISVDGYMAQIHFSNIETKHQGRYQLYIKNIVEFYYNFDIIISDKPDPPTHLVIDNISKTSAVISWISGNNNGHVQTFSLSYRKHKQILETSVILNHTVSSFFVGNLDMSTKYDVTVFASNDKGTSENITRTFQTLSAASSGGHGAIFGAVAGSVAAGILIVVIAIAAFKHHQKHTRPKSKPPPDRLDDNNDGLKANILYESAGPNYIHEPGPSTSDRAGAVYAMVQKPKSTTTFSQVYAEVRKPKKGTVQIEVHAEVQRTETETVDKDGLKPNILYESAGPSYLLEPGPSTSDQSGADYAIRKKVESKTSEVQRADEEAMNESAYAEV
ncbi:synaptogenesis protein syg-2-like [Ylistrum balloti]|uniref:synaptogenesis protein syg-2-like n=1 Tax=Ylistrum balloti TaxID=509963 RepID=UPI002905A7CD|nr:synaptogenesis protein syg-2-like [Ylistrum balloti]